MGKTVSIVMPVYNRAGIVGRTLRSIDAQTCRDFDVVLVDNASTDGTRAVLEAWAAGKDYVRVLACTEPGAAAARNAGLRAVHTPWTLFFDSDDIMLPAHIERINVGIHDFTEADILTFDIMAGHRRLPSHSRDLLYHNLMHGSLSTARYCARTELLRRVGGWNSSIRAWDDIVLGTRLLVKGKPRVVKLQGAPTVDVNFTDESISGVGFSHSANRFDAALDALAAEMPGERERVWVEVKRAILAADCAREGGTAVAATLFGKALQRTPRRWPVHMAYRWRRLGLRGAARILRPLL